jgi:hypothetical protein
VLARPLAVRTPRLDVHDDTHVESPLQGDLARLDSSVRARSRARPAPSWRSRPRLSEVDQSSTIRPSSKRLIVIPWRRRVRPRLLPSATHREATRSPSLRPGPRPESADRQHAAIQASPGRIGPPLGTRDAAVERLMSRPPRPPRPRWRVRSSAEGRGTAVVPDAVSDASNASLSGDGGDGGDGRRTYLQVALAVQIPAPRMHRSRSWSGKAAAGAPSWYRSWYQALASYLIPLARARDRQDE